MEKTYIELDKLKLMNSHLLEQLLKLDSSIRLPLWDGLFNQMCNQLFSQLGSQLTNQLHKDKQLWK